jgi:hypothetical protein
MRIVGELINSCSTNVTTSEAAAAAHNPSITEQDTTPAAFAPPGLTVRAAPEDMIKTAAGSTITMIASTVTVTVSVTKKPTAPPAAVAAETSHWR